MNGDDYSALPSGPQAIGVGNPPTARLFLGDCLEVMPFLKSGSIDMVLCDLPYGTTQNKWDAVIPFAPLWEEYRRLCRGAVVLTAQCPFDKVLGSSNTRELKYDWIWSKSKATGHLNANRQPLKNHENVLVFFNKQPTYNPQGLVRKAVATIRKGGNNGGNYGKSDKDAIQLFENYPRLVLPFPSEGATVHPTQKPVALLEYLIRTYTNPGDTVLDNTMGSGSTGVACMNTGRNFVGIEREPEYFQIAKRRVIVPGASVSSVSPTPATDAAADLDIFA